MADPQNPWKCCVGVASEKECDPRASQPTRSAIFSCSGLMVEKQSKTITHTCTHAHTRTQKWKKKEMREDSADR